HLQSQSNTGTTASRPEAWAKNVISVGGISHYNTLFDGDDAWTTASIGPAADGRMKPNVAAFYDAIYTTTSGAGYTSSFGGTSGATPIVAGCVGLIHEMWHAGIFGNATGATVFDSRPSDTLVRALLFASATPWDFTGGAHNRARTRQGWGRPDLEKLHAHRDVIHWVDESDLLVNLQTSTRWVTVQAGRPELRVALVWADPAGTTSANLHRVNDLDLVITSPTGVVYHGNWGLDGGVWSAAGGARDTINTEECVAVPWPAAGTWEIRVVAADINQDGHVETSAVDVDYSLAVLGAVPTAVGAPFDLRMSTSGGGTGDGLVGLDRVPVGAREGFCLLSFAAFGVPGSGPAAGLWADGLTFQCVASPVAPGNPMHWSWPVSGVFPAVDFTLPAGSVTFPAGTRVDGLGVALDGQGGVLATTPVRRAIF
ncbi:MAG: S8 family serine peptidase, partial [Planctomycetes bacterium]|nr:S8 family serine peptidase [Planctomycetota bacterium]